MSEYERHSYIQILFEYCAHVVYI